MWRTGGYREGGIPGSTQPARYLALDLDPVLDPVLDPDLDPDLDLRLVLRSTS